jgi:hypothetical protein
LKFLKTSFLCEILVAIGLDWSFDLGWNLERSTFVDAGASADLAIEKSEKFFSVGTIYSRNIFSLL